MRGGEAVVEALRGLERFTALEDEVPFERFLEVVRRSIETLRAEDVLEGDPGAFARRGVNVVAVNSLPGIEFARVWILGATEREFPPPARQDPILLDPSAPRSSARAGRLARGARRPRHRGGAAVHARVRGRAGAPGRLLCATRDG